MRTIFRLVMLVVAIFLCLPAFAQTRPGGASITVLGAGGVTVTSNGTIYTVDGSGVVATGTNSSIRISTNAALLTVATQVNFGASITGVVVGMTAHLGVNGASSDFTNAVNTLITNVLQSSTNSFGNAITNLVWNKTIFVDSSGNDTTGRRGDATKPFATVSNAFKVVTNGDTLLIRSGIYAANSPNGSFYLPCIGLTNLTNVSIVGSGSATVLTNGNIGSMFVIWGCSNIVMQDFTIRGTLTNGVIADQCAAVWEGGTNIGVKFLNMSFINWQNQGIADLGVGSPQSLGFVWQNCLFDSIGGTNFTAVGLGDGTAIGNVRSGDIIANCTFNNCLRCIESYESGVPDGVVFVNNVAKNIYGSAINIGGSNNVNWIIANNSFSARAALTSESAWIVAFSSTRSVIVNNNVQGFENILIWDSQANSTTFSDNLIAGNVFRNARQGIFAGQAVLNKLCERNAYLNNKFIHIGFTGIAVGGNGTRIEGNEFYDVGTNASSGYAIDLGNIGYSGAALTNFSNVTIKDNIIGNSGATAITDGSIRISAKATNTIVLGNRILAGSAISDAGVNTLGFDYVRLGADNLTATNFGIWAHPAGGTLDVSSQRGTFYAYSPNGDPLTNFNFGLFGGPGLRSMGNGFKVIDIANDPALGSFEAVSVFTKTNRVTNALVVAYGSPAAGQILTSVGTDGAVNWSNAPAGGSGGGASTNPAQFGPGGAVLTLKNGLYTTNLNDWGFITTHVGFFDAGFGGGKLLMSEATPTGEIQESSFDATVLDNVTTLTSDAQVQINAKMDENNGVSTGQTAHATLTIQNIRAQPFITLPATLHFDGTNQMQRTNAITGTKTIQLTNLTADVDYILEVDATGATATDLVVNFTGYSGVGPALTNGLTTYLIQKRGTTTNVTRMISDSALLSERTVVTNVISLSSSNATSKPLTNSFTAGILKLYGLEAGANTTITPNGSNYVIASTGGGGVTALSNLTDVVVTNMETGAVLTWIAAMGKWTNITPFYTYNIYVTTNIYLGTNFEQSISVTTNLPFKLFFEGTPRNGDVVHVSVSNYSASTIYATNTFFDTTVASNVTYWAIPALSIRKITFVNTTNHNLGVNRWELMTHAMKESELAVAGGLTMHTNTAQSIITLSNAALGTGLPGQTLVANSSGLMVATNGQPNVSYFTNGGTYLTFKGDSIVSGSGASIQTNSFPSRLHGAYLTGGNWYFATNSGLAGQAMSAMQNLYTNETKPWAPSGGSNSLHFFYAGINDISAGTTATNLFVIWSNYVWLARSDGFVVCAFTLLPANTLTSIQEFNRQRFNDLLRNAAGQWDYLIDVDLVVPPPPDLTYWSDYIHPANAGYDTMAYHINQGLLKGRYGRHPMGATYRTTKNFLGNANQSRGMWSSIYANAAYPGIMLEVNGGSGNFLAITPNPLETACADTFWHIGSGQVSVANDLRHRISGTNTSWFNGTNRLGNWHTNGTLETFGGVGSYKTNSTPDGTSWVGITNATTYTQVWNVRGTSGNIVFWNRTGHLGATPCGIALWTNTIIASGSDIIVGVNCGIAIDTGVNVVGGGRAF